MAPRSTALAGAQLAARQLNCESVFRGVLSYGRGRNNAPAGFVAARRSVQPGAARLASQRRPFGRKAPPPAAPFASPPLDFGSSLSRRQGARWSNGQEKPAIHPGQEKAG